MYGAGRWCWLTVMLAGGSAGWWWCWPVVVLAGGGAGRWWCWPVVVLAGSGDGRWWCWPVVVMAGDGAGRWWWWNLWVRHCWDVVPVPEGFPPVASPCHLLIFIQYEQNLLAACLLPACCLLAAFHAFHALLSIAEIKNQTPSPLPSPLPLPLPFATPTQINTSFVFFAKFAVEWNLKVRMYLREWLIPKGYLR